MALVDRRTNSVVLRIVYEGPPEAGKATNLQQLCERLSLRQPRQQRLHRLREFAGFHPVFQMLRAFDRLRAWVQVYHKTVLPNTPAIDTVAVDPPKAQLVALSTPLADFLLRAALGLVAGLILAYLFEYLDDTVQDEADVQYWLGLPTLAVIPGRRRSRLRSA